MRARPFSVLAVALLAVAVPPTDVDPVREAPEIVTLDLLGSDKPSVGEHAYPVRTLDGQLVAMKAWRVVQGTGNCCESALHVAPDGTIYDLGGTDLYVSRSEGRGWERVIPQLQPVIAEGVVVNGPDGSIHAVTWDAYGGDRIFALTKGAGENRWRHAQVALHEPFFDRPWLSVALGPITFLGETHPYAILLTGGLGTDTLVSFDGLTYYPTGRNEIYPVGVGSVPLTWPQPALAVADDVQPMGHSRIYPLPSGGAISTVGCEWHLYSVEGQWGCTDDKVPGSGGTPILRFDSRGRAHALELLRNDTLRYRWSEDGSTWRSVPLWNFTVDDSNGWDIKVDGALDMVAIGLRYVAPRGTQVAVIRITELSSAAPQVEVLELGRGDLTLGGSAIDDDRLDFVSFGILPDGRIVSSFADQEYFPPAVAIELPG